MEKLLIIGGVAGGATAAARARRLNKDIEITMLEAGPDVSFANCGLPYYIGGDIEARSSLILESPESFKDQYNVNVKTETEAIKIDRENRVVTALDKKAGKNVEYKYDKLIMAQGGKPIIPPLPGVDQEHVFSLWTLSDMDKIENYITKNKPESAVVIGGGFIGLEMVEALAKRDIKVNVVEMMPHVMPNMEAEIAGFIQEEMESYGVGIHTGRAVTSIERYTAKLDNGKSLDADMVLMSVGVKPTLQLAIDSKLEIGEAGGLLVDETLKTNDDNIYAAGDMVEMTHKIGGKKVRIPLAGPANKQGRIAASNALGQKMTYKGSQGTSVVRVFEAVAGSTGLNQKQAIDAGFKAQSIVIHKEHHTSYFPGSSPVTVLLTYDSETGIILGGQTCGYKAADKRLDVLATAAACKMTIGDLSELDLSYSPPIGTANDPVNMAAFVAQNRMTGYSPSITVSELDDFAGKNRPAFIDVRDYFAFERSHITGADHIPHTQIDKRLAEIPKDRPILIYSDKGKKGHQVVRELILKGYSDVYNIGGGFPSIERFARTIGFEHLHINLIPLDKKSVHNLEDSSVEVVEENVVEEKIDTNSAIVVDVRSPGEFAYGAYPGAINIPLDYLETKADELGAKDRDITLYCASGARSGYGVRVLQSLGFTNVKNGGGLMSMMAGLN
ncbi:CoA-disulfide reductase [Thiospirochaeta perfilievii]|uniref:CoA-disulfide reductase n=1 Tax=Thiospirochaeta perfilievii TaxID=252967 RepID=A0A5C1QD22_9SPIO|nr:FAD-dependent oxidoreductase [Thiospirochaeta perfilievii]QEN05248.1 CoA-disulfide reductase [Thiospirochaeta perfilievii]